MPLQYQPMHTNQHQRTSASRISQVIGGASVRWPSCDSALPCIKQGEDGVKGNFERGKTKSFSTSSLKGRNFSAWLLRL